MNNKRLIYLVGFILLITATYFLFFNNSNNNQNQGQNRPSIVSAKWITDDFSLKSTHPYGLFVFEELIKASGQFDEFNSYTDYNLFDSLVKTDSSLFMYIGDNIYLTKREIYKIMASVAMGNDLFISTRIISTNFKEFLFKNDPILFFTDSVANHKINGESHGLYYVYEQDTLNGYWDVFDKKKLRATATVVSEINQYGPVFIKINYGKGNVLVHLNPLTFSNYQLLSEDGGSYFKEVIKEFNQPKIQWLTFAKYEPQTYDPYTDWGEYEAEPGLLVEMFKHPAFRWGFIMAVIGIILYLIFRSKRRRPVIPANADTKNTGFSYVDTLAGIYYDKNHSEDILKIMKRNFQSAVYEKFYVDISKDATEERTFKILSQKSNVPLQEIEDLVKSLRKKSNVNNDYLNVVYNKQRSFYFKSGIWDQANQDFFVDGAIHIYREKTHDIILSIIGFSLIALGFILLANSTAVGVLFWPIGAFGLFTGMRSLSTPAIRITPTTLELTSLFGLSREISIENIKFIERKEDETLLITLKNDKKINFSLARLEGKNIDLIEMIKLSNEENI